MSSTLVTALVFVGGLFLVITFLIFIHNRDRKKDAKREDAEKINL